jgi:hypothetical protein
MKIKLLCSAVVLALTASVVGAQDDLQAYILEAYENTQALETFVYETESEVAQVMGMGGGMSFDTETTVTTTTQGERVGDVVNVAAQSQTEIGSMMGAMGFGFELVYVDGQLWARGAASVAEDAGGEDNPMGGMMGDIFGEMFPAEWTNITETPDAYPSLSVYSNPELILPQLTDAAGLYVVSEAVLATVEELPAEELDGRTVRVFQFTANPADLTDEARAAIDSAIAAASQASGGGGAAGMGDMSAMMDGMFEDLVENMLITVTLYVDEAENLVVQSVVEQTTTMNMDMQGMEIAIDQTSTTTSRLVEYNTDVVIEAPVR